MPRTSLWLWTVKKRLAEIFYFASAAAGALLVALNIGYQLEGYIFFLISSFLGSYLVLISDASRSILWVNVMFGVINIIGIIRA